jgi:hypothetical protein
MPYRLLVDFDALLLLQQVPKRVREDLISVFRQLRETPDQLSDYNHRDKVGRLIDVALRGKYAIYYWIDFPDRSVKIVEIKLADR